MQKKEKEKKEESFEKHMQVAAYTFFKRARNFRKVLKRMPLEYSRSASFQEFWRKDFTDGVSHNADLCCQSCETRYGQFVGFLCWAHGENYFNGCTNKHLLLYFKYSVL